MDGVNQGIISVSNGGKTFFIDNKGTVQEEMPILDDFGKIIYDGQIVKAIVDGELIYYNEEGQVIWEENPNLELGNGREVIRERYKHGEMINIDYPLFVGFIGRKEQEKINDKLGSEFLLADASGRQIEDDEFRYYKTRYRLINEAENLRIVKIYKMMEKNSFNERTSKLVFNLNLETGEFNSLKDIFKKESNYIKDSTNLQEEQLEK